MPSKHKFKHGEPVWARMEGYPWWPGHIVKISEVVLDKGENQPHCREGELLVEFFNDNKRFAPMHERALRPFLSLRYSALNDHYSGAFKANLDKAVKEAKKYCQDKGLKMEEEDGRSFRPVKPKSTSHEEEELEDQDEQREEKKGKRGKKKATYDDHQEEDEREERKGKRGMKRAAEDPEEELDDRDRERAKRKKKKKHPKRETSPPERVEDHERDEPDKLGENRQKRKYKRKHRDLEADEGTKKHRDLDDGRRKRRNKDDVDADAQPSVPYEPVPRKQKHRKESQPQQSEASLPLEKEDGTNMERSVEATGEVFKEKPVEPNEEKVDRKAKRERADKVEDKMPTELNIERKPKREHNVSSQLKATRKRSKEEKEKPAVDKELLASPDPNQEAPFEEGAAYQSLSKQQLINVLIARDIELRSYRVQMWQYRLENDRGDCLRKKDDLIQAVAPAFKTVADFLTISEREAHREKKSTKWKNLEKLSVETVSELRKVYFDISLLKESRLSARALKLARKSAKYSLEVARVFREVIVQWVDIFGIEQVSDEDRLPGSGVEKAELSSVEPEGSPEGEDVVKKSSDTKASDEKPAMSEPTDTVQTNTKSPNRKSPEAKSPDQKSPGIKASSAKTDDAKSSEAAKPADNKRSEITESEDKHSSLLGTPARDPLRPNKSPEEKTSPGKGEGDSSSKQEKLERLGKEFSTEKCVAAFTKLLNGIKGLDVDGERVVKERHRELAEAMETVISPRIDEDFFAYFMASKNVVRVLTALQPGKASPDSEDKTKLRIEELNALLENPKDLSKVSRFVKRVGEGLT